MQRREVIRVLGASFALPFLPRSAEAAIELGERIHRQPAEVPLRTLNREQQVLVTEIAEIIIPETDTPGATSVKVPEFIDLILTEWATEEEKTVFLAGLTDIDARAAAFGAPRFVELTGARKTEMLTALDTARADTQGAGLAFARLKALTIYGYFTSKPGQERVLKTRIFFTEYQGNVPFTPAI
jgi:hypothetical protein